MSLVDRVGGLRASGQHLADRRVGVGVDVEVVGEVALRIEVDRRARRARSGGTRRSACGPSSSFPYRPSARGPRSWGPGGSRSCHREVRGSILRHSRAEWPEYAFLSAGLACRVTPALYFASVRIPSRARSEKARNPGGQIERNSSKRSAAAAGRAPRPVERYSPSQAYRPLQRRRRSRTRTPARSTPRAQGRRAPPRRIDTPSTRCRRCCTAPATSTARATAAAC